MSCIQLLQFVFRAGPGNLFCFKTIQILFNNSLCFVVFCRLAIQGLNSLKIKSKRIKLNKPVFILFYWGIKMFISVSDRFMILNECPIFIAKFASYIVCQLVGPMHCIFKRILDKNFLVTNKELLHSFLKRNQYLTFKNFLRHILSLTILSLYFLQ